MSGKHIDKHSTKGKSVVDFDDIDPQNAKLHRKKKLKSNAQKGGFAALGFIRILIYVAAIILVSTFLASKIISIVNDIYAFGDVGSNKDKIVLLTFTNDSEEDIQRRFKEEAFYDVTLGEKVKINHSNAKDYIDHIFDLGYDEESGNSKHATLDSVVIYMEKEVVFEEGTSLKKASKQLKQAGIIDHPLVFRLYAKREYNKSKYYTGEIKPGTVTFKYTYYDSADDKKTGSSHGTYIALSKDEDASKKPLNYDRIISIISMSTYKARSTVRVTIPEGLTVEETIDLLVKNGVGEKEKYIDVIQNHNYQYRFVKEIPDDPDRKWRLEGYLFPDTYDFFTDESEVSVINKLLENFEEKFDKIYYDRASELDMSVDDLIILASILEKEAKNPTDLPKMSAVFHNRLKASMQLDSDATVTYLLDEHKQVLTAEDLAIDSPYNTRMNKGLPPGGISNPGIEAINAAFYPTVTEPEASCYYFLSTLDGNTVYSKTLYEHNAAKNKAKSEGNLLS